MTTQTRLDPAHLALLVANRFAVLATIHPDGRPHLSLVQQHCHDGVADISLTEARVKTANLRADPRAALLVLPRIDDHTDHDGFGAFIVAEGAAQLGDTAQAKDDQACDDLCDLYRALAGEHRNWHEYRLAMINDRRLRCRIVLTNTYHGGAGA